MINESTYSKHLNVEAGVPGTDDRSTLVVCENHKPGPNESVDPKVSDTKISRVLTGKVVSDRMDKTIVVSILKKVPHPKYGKYIRRRTLLFAHDPANSCQVGEVVMIKSHRPISKRKHYILLKKVKNGGEVAT